MTYREAHSLATLLAEVDAMAPRRSRLSDGWIGDAAHASRSSDHNPWVRDSQGVGVVRARDFTHDPLHGLDGEVFAAKIAARLGVHPALGSGAYVIWNGQIISTARKAEGWRTYTGSNRHDKHVHVSVGTSGYDSAAAWLLVPARPAKGSLTPIRKALTRAGWKAKRANRPSLAERIFRVRDNTKK